MIFFIIILLVRICYTDIRYRIIENKCVLLMFLLNITLWVIDRQPIYLLSSLVIFSVGAILVLIHCVGAGDIKLLTVLGMVFPLGKIPDFIFLVALSGLPLILVIYCFHRFSKGRFSKTLPYGVAITGGYLLSIIV